MSLPSTTKRHLWLLGAIFWMALIFFLSSKTGEQSFKQSGAVTSIVISNLEINTNSITPYAVGVIIRKAAHFSLFFVLGIFFYGYFGGFKFKGLARYLLAMLATALYAVVDELHQLFVINRSSSVVDVLIDAVGGAAGALFFMFFIMLLKRLKRRKNKRLTKC